MSKKKNEKQVPSAPARKRNLLSGRQLPLVLLALVFLVYGNSIRNGYAMDDEYYTNSGSSPLNDYIRQGFSGIPAIFKSRTFFGEEGGGSSYRPVAAATFAVEYALAGENPHVSHFISVALYAVVVLLLFALLRRWFKAQGNWFAFFITLLFLVHPLHTEVVDNIKCRDELLALLSGIGCLYFAWRFYETKRWLFLALYPLCFFAGMLSKYTVIPYVAILPLVFYFFSDLKIKQALLYTLPLIVVALLVIAIQQFGLPPQDRVFQLQENPLYTEHVGLLNRIATAAYVSGNYLLLHFFPHPLRFYYGYREVEIVGFDNIFALLSILVFAGLGFLAFRGLRKKTILSFSILFFGLHIAAYSNLLRPAPGLMAERYALSASLGFCIALVWLVFYLFKNNAEQNSRIKGSTGIILAGIALLFSIRTMVRNTDWKDKMTLYSHDIEYLSESAKANLMLGGHLVESSIRLNREGQQLEAQGIRDNAQVRYMRADSMLRAGIEKMEQAVAIDSSFTKAWNNLASYYYLQGDYNRAIETYQKSLRRDSSNQVAWTNMGLCFVNQKNPEAAEQCYRVAIRTDSTYMQAYRGLAQQLTAKGKTPEAIHVLRVALHKNRKEANIPLESLAKIAVTRGDTNTASFLLAEAAFIRPDNIAMMRNLVDHFRRKGNTAKADALQRLITMQEEKEKRSYVGRMAKKK